MLPRADVGDRAEEQAVSVLRAHRDALRARDLRGVEQTVDLQMSGEGERGAFARLAYRDGLAAAAAHFSRGLEGVRFELRAVRPVSDHEFEIYEARFAPGDDHATSVLSLLRRRDGQFRVVQSGPGGADLFSLWLLDAPNVPGADGCGARAGAAATPPSLMPREALAAAVQSLPAEITRCDAELVSFVDPERGFEARLRRSLLGDLAESLEAPIPNGYQDNHAVWALSLRPSVERGERLAQLLWFSRLAGLLDGVRADASPESLGDAHAKAAFAVSSCYLPRCEVVRDLGALRRACEAGGDLTLALSRLWVHVEKRGSSVRTRGLCHFGLPELETSLHVWPSQVAAGEVIEAAQRLSLMDGDPWVPGARVHLGQDDDFVGDASVQLGGRGPSLGRTYGRWGSRSLARAVTQPTP